ncbi:hypothetical protein FJT64_008998 [Amphibalanus amphitrite]|nr:hypothetical protein FJT64_008998 [Amphibalanus amphitrite]
MSQCHDTQTGDYYNEGDFWSSKYSGCKLSTCVNINGVLNVERYSHYVKGRMMPLPKHMYPYKKIES